MSGDQIAIHEGDCTVLLQPLRAPLQLPASERPPAREALRQLQSQPRLTAAQAQDYLREARTENVRAQIAQVIIG